MKHRPIIVLALTTIILTACQTISPTEKQELTGESLYYKGIQYLSGYQTTKDEHKAMQYFKAASDKGYSAADNALAVMYDEGIAVKADKKLALQYYEKAASTGEASAQYNLAAYYYENDPNNSKLQEYLQKSVNKNDSDALNIQARIEMKDGFMTKAYQTFLQSSQSHNPDALFYLYLMNKEGQGTPRNDAQALSYLKKAVALDQVNALFTLGAMYLQGDGVEKNTTKAFQLFEKAAQEGHTKAIVNLALMYSKGDGIEKNTKYAAQLMQIAAIKGDPQASSLIKVNKNKITN